MQVPNYFIPDRDPPIYYPLQSYLRGVPANVAETYIDALTAPGDLVIDPFAVTPTVARAAHGLGRRAIGVQSNPLWAWLARTMSTLPPAQQIDAALARLADTLKDDVPLSVHIDQLYATTCAACHQVTSASYFVHARNAGPIQRHYACEHCGETRDDPATEEDLKRFQAFGEQAMHYHLAFERIAPPGELHAERIRKMLAVYTPRNLYALVTLTLKIDSLFYETPERDILRLLLLHLLDRGTSFYANAASDTIARLTAHKQFVEFNLWREIINAARALARAAPGLALAGSAVEVASSASVSLFVGRGSARTLSRALAPNSAALVVSGLTSRRLAVWALSYLWCAWVLGRQAAQPLVAFLDSRKDAAWERRWYFDSLLKSLKALTRLLLPGGHVTLVFSESWQQVIEELLLAAAGANCELDSFLFQPRIGQFPRREFDDIRGNYTVTFATSHTPSAEQASRGEASDGLEKQIRAVSLAAGREILKRRGEPLAFSWVHHAAYTRAMRDGLLTQAMRLDPKAAPGRLVHSAVLAGLSEGYAHDLDHYESRDQFLWMRRTSELDPPLVDRVDDAVRELLSQRASISREELDRAIASQFPGDLTPEAGLIELCAAAYADNRDGKWQWRPENLAEQKTRALDLLAQLGDRLEYSVISRPRPGSLDTGAGELSAGDFDLAWLADGELAHGFIWREAARFADVCRIHLAPAHGYLLVPESRVALLREKTRRQPHLADAFSEAGWDYMRIPIVERMLGAAKIEKNDLAPMAGLIPRDAEEKTQLELF